LDSHACGAAARWASAAFVVVVVLVVALPGLRVDLAAL
jgi:hypothetical protein